MYSISTHEKTSFLPFQPFYSQRKSPEKKRTKKKLLTWEMLVVVVSPAFFCFCFVCVCLCVGSVVSGPKRPTCCLCLGGRACKVTVCTQTRRCMACGGQRSNHCPMNNSTWLGSGYRKCCCCCCCRPPPRQSFNIAAAVAAALRPLIDIKAGQLWLNRN